MVWLASCCAEQGHEVVVTTLEAPETEPFYPLPAVVHLVQLDRMTRPGRGRFTAFLSRLIALRQTMRRLHPDVVISFMNVMNMTVLLAGWNLKRPIIVSERIDPTRHRIGWLKTLARRLLYLRASCCVVPTGEMAAYFHRFPGLKIASIPNPVPLPATLACPDLPDAEGCYRIVTVGRLDYQKGFDRLIRAFADLAARYPRWNVIVLGEGKERGTLETLVRAHGLESRIHLAGVVRGVEPYLAAAHIMAFPSRYEAFPNALAEGLAAGLPVVAFADVSGVAELIRSNETGLLAESELAFAQALARLMEDAALRARLGTAARQSIERFHPAAIGRRWQELVVQTGEQHDRPHPS